MTTHECNYATFNYSWVLYCDIVPKPPEYTMQLGPIKNQNYVSKDIQKSCAFIWLVPIFEKKCSLICPTIVAAPMLQLC